MIPVNPHEAEGRRAPGVSIRAGRAGPIDMATVYVPPAVRIAVVEQLAQKGVAEVWLNPGADEDEVVERARELGLNVIQACSIIAIGESPSRF